MAIGGFSDEIEYLNWRWNNPYILLILQKYKNLPSLLLNHALWNRHQLIYKTIYSISEYLGLDNAAAGYYSNNQVTAWAGWTLGINGYFIYIFSWSIFKNIDNLNPMVMSCDKLILSRAAWGHTKLQVHSRSRSTGTTPFSLLLLRNM